MAEEIHRDEAKNSVFRRWIGKALSKASRLSLTAMKKT